MHTRARFCVDHHNVVIGGWLILLVVLGGAVGALGTHFSDSTRLPASDSATAYGLLARGGSNAASGTIGTIVWHTDGGGAVAASTESRIEPMLADVAKVAGVQGVVDPFTAKGASQVSADGHTAYATVTFSSTAHEAEAGNLAKAAATSSVAVEVGGTAFTPIKSSPVSEVVGVVAALLILLFVFRSGWAAAMPILTGVAGVGISSLVVLLLSHVVTIPSVAPEMGALIGLGVGIDYALLIVDRHRSGLRSGVDLTPSIMTAMNTSGRAVLFAGGTVIIALLGMLVLNVGLLTGLAISAAVMVALTVVAAQTLLPALLARIGVRILRRSERVAARNGLAVIPPAAEDGRGVWSRWSSFVGRHPRPAGAAALLVLVILAAPALSIRLGAADASSDPAGTNTHSYYTTMSHAFGDGFDSRLLLVAQTPDDQARAAWASLVGELPEIKGVASVSSPVAVTGDTLSMVTVQPTTTSQAKATTALVSSLRTDQIRSAEAGTDLQVHVGGTTATSIDFAHALTDKLPLFLGIIAVLGFLLLMVAFRSLLIPLIGALGNLLTIADALGATVALFQWGWGPTQFGIGGPAPLEYIVAMLIVGVTFGLSMDYHVFLVSRMHETWTHTGDNQRSVRTGVSRTGRVITTAAAIMACVFASFGLAGVRTVSEFGAGLAVAVLADAILLRMTVIPAMMHVTGDGNWSIPRWLDRLLPHVSVEGSDPESVSGLPLPRPVREDSSAQASG